jgi:PDZ domain
VKYRKDYLVANTSMSMIAVALCLQLPLAARADYTMALKPESASLDASLVTNQATATAAGETTLEGGVRKRQDALDGTGATSAPQNPPQEASAADNDVKLQAETASKVFKLAAQKLSSGARLSADEYRALGVGCTGFEADKPFFQNIAKVSVVYPGSPADKAGIRKGDKIVANQPDNEQARANPFIPQWQVKLGRAGTPIDVTVLRQGQPVTLSLVRMNIEDIEDAKYRERWEKIVRDLGYQSEGTFTGTGHHPDYSADGR